MKTFQELINSSYSYRISLGERWAVREMDGTFTVYEQCYGCRRETIVDCVCEEAAVLALTNQEGIKENE